MHGPKRTGHSTNQSASACPSQPPPTLRFSSDRELQDNDILRQHHQRSVAQHVSRVGREGKYHRLISVLHGQCDTDIRAFCQIVELPVHLASTQHQRRRQAEGRLRPYQDQGCRSPLLQPCLQEGRCRPEQACRRAHLYETTIRGRQQSAAVRQCRVSNHTNANKPYSIAEELERIVTIIQNPTQYKIPGCTAQPDPRNSHVTKVQPGRAYWTPSSTNVD